MSENLACQEERREELIHGKVVAMSPRPSVNHNRVAFNIAVLFDNYLKGKMCTPFSDGTDLYLTEDDRFIPDMMIVCDPDKIKSDGVHGAPDLVVKVLSPNTCGMIGPTRRTFTPAAASGNTGLSALMKSPWRSTAPLEPNLSFTTFSPASRLAACADV